MLLSRTAQPFDPDEILCVLDATEATGAPPDMVEYLRCLVLAESWGWTTPRVATSPLPMRPADQVGMEALLRSTVDRMLTKRMAREAEEMGDRMRSMMPIQSMRYRNPLFSSAYTYTLPFEGSPPEGSS